jgi:uncharacterized protein YcaQ
VATVQCLRDYFRMDVAPTRQAVAELVEDGTLLPVQVEAGAGRRTSTATRGCPAASARPRC